MSTTSHVKQTRVLRAACEPVEPRRLLATLPNGFTESVVASGLSNATAIDFSPDGKLFVAEQTGTMEVWQNGARLRDNFFQNTPLTLRSNSERGLLGIAFDPNYASNRYVYVYYTSPDADAHNRVSRFTANAAGDAAIAGSENVILELDPHSAGNHNGGAMHFGPDGMLYIAAGDNATGANAQSLATRHGKILRIDVTGDDFPADAGNDYRIPAGQPTSFGGISGTTTGLNRAIWAVGVRNPFTFAFQPGTGRLFINDVGQDTYEEINEGGAGRNFGWPGTEGSFNGATFPGFTQPFYAYDHGGAEPNGIAITGGTFYNPTTQQFPAQYAGDYFFADYGSGEIWSLDLSSKQATKFASGISAVVDLKADAAGNLYYLARGSGQVMKVSFASQPPAITDAPDSTAATIGASATFSAAASGAGPLKYQWQRAESGTTTFANINGATGTSYTLANVQSADNGDRFRIVVTDAVGRSTASAFATLTANANQPPVAAISIAAGLRNGKFDAGKAITFAGSATDPEQGKLGAASLTWRVDYLSTINGGDADKDGLPGITRPFVASFSNAAGGTFTPATTGPYTLADVAHVITLTATDAQGRTDVEQYIAYPNVVTLTAATNPAGLQVTVDGQPFAAPRSFASVVGFQRPIGAAASQSLNGATYAFKSWSDGGAATHTISTPTTNATYTATFAAQPTSSFGAKVNFQDAASQGYAGYAADIGRTFASRGNGLTYGWDTDNGYFARNRNLTADERYDTFNHLQKNGGGRVWEIAVPNGTYTVHLVAGDPDKTDQTNTLRVENVVLSDPDGQDHFDEYTTTVTVTDGRLSISAAPGASNAKIAFVEIASVGAARVAAALASPAAKASTSARNVDLTFGDSRRDDALSGLSL